MAIYVENIAWNRTYFEVDYTADEDEELLLYRTKTDTFLHFDSIREGRKVHGRINITTAQGRAPLEAGDWILSTRIPEEYLTDIDTLLTALPHMQGRMENHVRRTLPPRKRDRTDKAHDDELIAKYIPTMGFQSIKEHPYDTSDITYNPEIPLHAETYARIFRYATGYYQYNACLIPRATYLGELYLVLSMTFLKVNRNPRVRRFSLRFREKQILAACYRVIAFFSHWDPKRVLFMKENGEEPNENMDIIRRRMIERGLDQEFTIVERYRNTFRRFQNILAWFGDMRQIAQAGFIFIDDYAPVFNFLKLNKKTVLTQVWHAGVGFKSVGYARFGISGSPDPFSSGHRSYTYALVGNEHLRDIYSEVFGIEEEALLATGMPRLEHFLDDDVVEAATTKLQDKYPWLTKGRVLLFAPTFRGTGQLTAFYPYEAYFDFKRLYEMLERTNSYFIFEMHHFIVYKPVIPKEYRDRIIDLSDESFNELCYVSDVLITDYSSCFYDYQLLKRPVVFYVPDKVTYSATRGVQRSIDEMAPGQICESFDELLEVLETESYQEKKPDVSSLDRCIEGGMLATDRVIDTILLGKDVPGVRKEAQ